MSWLIKTVIMRYGGQKAHRHGIWFFLGLLAAHDRVLRGRRRAERAAEHYDQGLKRLDDRWAGGGTPGDTFLDPDHPYAADLDLFGRGRRRVQPRRLRRHR